MKLDAIAMGQPVAGVGALADAVAGAGFDGLWFTEGGRSAYLGCTAAALSAPGLDIGTAVALAFPRSWLGSWPSSPEDGSCSDLARRSRRTSSAATG